MIRPRWRKVLSDLWGNPIRSLLVIASIAIGLLSVGLIAAMHVIIQQDMRVGYALVNPANVQINASSFDRDLVERIRHLPDVRQAEGVRILTVRVKTGPDDWSPMDIQAIPDMDEKQINQLKLVVGVYPPQDRELVVDRFKLDELNAALGDELEIELPSGKVRRMRLVGIVHDQTIGSTGGGGFFLAPAQGYITLETLPWLEQPPLLNRMLVTVDDFQAGESSLRAIANHVSDEMERNGCVVFSNAMRASDDHPNRVYVQAIAAVLFLLGFMAVFLSGFLITNTLTALLNQQMQQVGIMKAVGARRRQVMAIYMVLIFAFSLIAFLIAFPISARAAYGLLELLVGEINMDLQGFRFVPFSIALQLIIALVVPQAAGFIPILHGTRISVVEAFSGYSQSKPPSRKSRLDRWLENVRFISRPQLISLRNTFRRKGRLFLTLLTLTLGGAIFIATFNVRGSLEHYINRLGRYFLADVNLTLGRNYRISEIENILLQVEGVAAVEAWAGVRSELIMPDGTIGESITLFAPPAASRLVEPILLEGRWLMPGDENAIAVSERFREIFPDLKVGDSLRLKVNGEETDMVVVGFFQLSGRSAGYLAYATYEHLSQLIRQPKRANNYRVIAERSGMTLEEQRAFGIQIEKALEARGIAVAEVSEGLWLTSATSDGLTVLTGFLLMMASLIALVGSIGLTGTMSMNVLERTREIGILRSIGASDRVITSLVMVEGLLIGILSWIFGVVLAFPISTLLSNAINFSLFGAPVEFTFTPTGILVWLVVVLILSALASLMPARNATRLTIREVLAYE